ncbi:DUF998 domain-containing protein [Gordonia sp. ABSL1-1]|uniref:DUF998 domain-containing protein n=1 Tax=Gordonia sp. ABSL1-1 TaxID=3053923 RepID=UPI002573D4BE|nr:DUF998 domain-containing protein [Gordonia sp. ABSL1-1]MDL9938129.1 DUF998 domain-containing protein [Gordonia sp. ABSL1-1]
MSDTVKPRVIVAGVLIAIAGICYSSWVLEFCWPSPFDPMRTFLSELDSEHRPHRLVYVAGDVTTGVCSLLAGILLLVPRPAVRRAIPITAIAALAAFGAATIADALLPIECIAGLDPGCRTEPSGLLPQLHHVHALTSTLAVFAIFTVMVAGSVAALRRDAWPLLRIAGTAILVIVALATVWMLVADNLTGNYRLGLAQRIQVGGMSVWLMLWGAALIRSAFARINPDDPARIGLTPGAEPHPIEAHPR